MLKRLFKIFLFLFAAFIVLLVLAAGLTQTGYFKTWLRDEIVRQAAASMQGTLRLGRISGNLVTNFGFHDLCIDLDQDTVLHVPNLEVKLSPFKLLRRQVVVNNLVFHAPRFSLRQRPDSTWNVTHLLKPASSTATPETASLWRLALQNLRVEDGAFIFTPLDTAAYKFLPRQIRKIWTSLRLDYADKNWRVVLRNMQLKAFDPNVTIDSLAAQVSVKEDSLLVKNLKLRSDHSRFAGQITLRHFTRPIFSVDLQSMPLYLEDLRPFFPRLPVIGPLHGTIHAIGDVQNLRTTFHLRHADGSADGNFFVLQDSAAFYYDLEAAVRALNLTPYLHDSSGTTQVNFDIKLDGSGMTLEDLNANLALAIDSSQVLGRDMARLRLTARAFAKQIHIKLSAHSSLGELELSGKLFDPQRRQNFEVNAEARHLNLTRLLHSDTLDSDLSFRLAGSGQHFDFEQLNFDGWLRVFPSRLPAILIDSAYCQFHTHKSDFQLDTLHLASSLGNIQAAGLLSLRYDNNFRFRAELGDLTWVKQALEADTLRAAGIFTGSASGPLDSLLVISRFNLRQVQYNTTSIKRLAGNLTFQRRDNEGGGMIQMRGNDLLMGYLPVDSATAVAHYDLKQAQISADFRQGERNHGKVEGLYTFGEVARFEVWHAVFNVLGQTWRAPEDSAIWVDIGEEDYDFHNFVLISGDQRLRLDGLLDYLGTEDLRFKIENVDIAALASGITGKTASGQNTLSGILNMQAHLTGNAEAPILHGQLSWLNGRVADFAFAKWDWQFRYEAQRLAWEFVLHQNQDRQMTGEGYLPVNLALDNVGKVLYDDRPIRLQAATTGIDLAFLQTLTNQVKNVQGTLVFDVKVENTLQQPRSKGAVRIIDGAFSVPKYGINYNDLQLVAAIDTASVKITSFLVQSDKGSFEAGGKLYFSQQAITEANGFVKARDFLAIRNRNLELRLDANINASGDLKGARYQGDVTVVRSRFFLPALQQRSIIQLDETDKIKSAPADCTAIMASQPGGAASLQRWLQNLRGELKLNIPRNTWIRGPELNAEISGALDFIQEGITKFSLFGTLNIIRGTYELYGKKFDIEKGQITFQGDFRNPQIELAASHFYRAQGETREKKSIEVKISGLLASPQIEFLQAGEPLDEKDALANLIFGVNFDQLLYGQRKGLEAESNKEMGAFSSAAKGLVSGLVSQQLTQSLGRSLNLDLIEFQGSGDLSQSSVLVGKYLTNNLFISFGQEPEGRVVSLEWEVPKWVKNLFLQAAHGGEENRKTGFDLIWKVDW